MNEIIFIVIGVAIGFTVTYLLKKASNKKLLSESQTEAQKIISNAKNEAENLKANKIFQAKEKFLELKSEHEKYILSKESEHNEKKQDLKNLESEIKQKSKKVDKLKIELDEKISTFTKKTESLEKKNKEIDKIKKDQVQQIEKISGYTADEAKEELLKILKDEVKSQALEISQNIIDEAKLSAKQEAKKIIITSIQRLGTEEAIDNCVSVFNIESDDMKGRIIGREGRNIKAIESATGVEIIVDDTPEAIILSCFDSVRREVARLSLKKLVSDGRIHPARIEEVVKKTKVIASLAGPFSKYSNELVNQCYENNTNYVDITGENIWVRDLIDRYHKGCEDKGIFIIPSCGYDSIPSDIGSFYCHMMLNENIDHIDGYHTGKGGVSGGTIESAFNMKNYKSSYKTFRNNERKMF